MISWTVLGSGTHMASATRNSPGHLVACGETRILVDCGAGSFHGVARAGTAVEDLDACLLTHLHPDHVGDLLALLFRLRNVAKERGHLALQIFGPPGTTQFVEDLQRLHAPFLEHADFALSVGEGSSGDLQFPGLRVSCAPVAHGLPAVAYSFESAEGERAVYSGDTGRSADLIRFAEGTDLLVIESSFPNGEECPFHLTPAAAADIAEEAGVDTMILVHLNPEMDEVDIVGQVGDRFSGRTIVGTDFLTRVIGEGES